MSSSRRKKKTHIKRTKKTRKLRSTITNNIQTKKKEMPKRHRSKYFLKFTTDFRTHSHSSQYKFAHFFRTNEKKCNKIFTEFQYCRNNTHSTCTKHAYIVHRNF